ncbi:MAG: hypothetical protein ACTHOE_02695 [Conexibacter sp.]
MFERIARRQADRPAEDEGQATADLPTDDRPTEQMAAVTPPAADPATATAPAPTPPQTDATSEAQAPAAPQTDTTEATAATVVAEPAPRRPGFRARGRMRRRLRYLRRLRELQVRDLGGLVFDLRRFERKRDDLIAQKIDQIRACDDELRALEQALAERRDLRDVREPGIGGTCPRCFAIYGSADKFCANCGAAFGGAVQGPAAQIPLAPSAPPPPTAPSPPASTPEAGSSGPQA